MKAVEVLEAAGYETIIFHAIGSGGLAMEQLMKEGSSAVLDYSTIEVSNQMFHALLAGEVDRLTTAGKLGFPQVIARGRSKCWFRRPRDGACPVYIAARSSATARRSPTFG